MTSEEELPDDYLEFTLNILDDRMEGRSQQLEGFTVSMKAPTEFLKYGFNYAELINLVRNQDITGTVKYPSSAGSLHDGKTTEIKFEIVNHRGIEEIYMKSTLGFFLWEYVKVQEDKLSFAIYWWYCPPARKVDLEILEMVEQLLTEPANWHQNDDRVCEHDIENNLWSLFCALKHASIEKMGEYNHHNTAIQTVRFVIDDIIPNHEFMHTLMDYNNAPSTTHKNILNVIDMAKERIKGEIK